MTTDALRVAAGQFVGSTSLEQNLAACLRLIDQAADQSVDLLVLPEFANHLSVYDSAEHCRQVAVPIGGPWLAAIAQRAREHSMHVAVTVTVPRPDSVTVTSLLFDDVGSILGEADKQTLMGNERAFLTPGDCGAPVVRTRFGAVGIFACMDGVTFETPRTFAVRGARLFLNGLNSFALDEAHLHIPVRAVENGVFVVAANKVGALLPAAQIEQFSAALGVPADALDGAGESQIIDPNGVVVARASRTTESLVVADIDLGDVKPIDKRLGYRRPDIYAPLASPATSTPRLVADEALAVACAHSVEQAQVVAQGLATLVVLPEMVPPPEHIGENVWVVATTMRGGAHIGQVVTRDGVVHEQMQLHQTDRLPQVTTFGDEVGTLTTPWGDMAVLIGDDHAYPEAARLAAIQGVHLIAVVWHPTEQWQVDLALAERAAENRLCVVACAPASVADGSVLFNPPRDSLWNSDRVAPFDGTINTPDRVSLAPAAQARVGAAHLVRSLRREISRDTDLVGGRSWQASKVLIEG